MLILFNFKSWSYRCQMNFRRKVSNIRWTIISTLYMSLFGLPQILYSFPIIKQYTRVHWKHVLAFKQQISFMHLQQFSVFPNHVTIWYIISTKLDYSVIDLTSFLVPSLYEKLNCVIILNMKTGRLIRQLQKWRLAL